MASRRPRIRVGDILAVHAPTGAVYLHYLGKHPVYGDTVVVAPGIRERRQSVTGEIFADGYVIFYPATLDVAEGFAEVVGHAPAPGIPTRLRRAGARSRDRVETWIIEDESGEVVKWQFSDEELQLPIAAIRNHAALLERVAEGWHPTHECAGPSSRGASSGDRLLAAEVGDGEPETMSDDGRALAALFEVSTPGAVHTVRHYLYLPTRKAASLVAAELRRCGYRTEERCAALGRDWLVLAQHEVVPSEELLAATRERMEALVARVAGEYDGWEAEVCP